MNNSVIGDYLNNTFYPTLYLYIDTVFPEMQFSKKGDRWVSPLKKDGSTPSTRTREKTVIKEKMCFLIMEGGEPSEEIISWVCRTRNYANRLDAIKDISRQIGLTMPNLDSEEFKQYSRLQEAKISAYNEMQQVLMTPAGKVVLDYLQHGRGYSLEQIQEMGLGCITKDIADKYRDILKFPKGVEIYNQLVFPYYTRGRISFFKFRKTREGAFAKWVNTAGSNKSADLFGLSPIARKNKTFKGSQIILVDGELKAMYMACHGFENVVSGAGSDSVIISSAQISEAQKLGVKHVIIIADNESSDKERANEIRKVESTLQELNRAGLVGHVVYLPHKDKTKKEDVEDFLREYGKKELERYISRSISGAEFRANNIYLKYLDLQGGNPPLSSINAHDFFAEIKSLMGEYACTEIAVIKSTVSGLLGAGMSEWQELLDNFEREEKAKQQQRTEEITKRQFASDIKNYIEQGNIDGALACASQAQAELKKNKSADYSSVFAAPKWNQITAKLKELPDGIATPYQVKRGKEVDKIILPCGGLSIIAAPTNHGKSTMLQNLALYAARNKDLSGAILYLTFEESTEEVTIQLLSKTIGVKIGDDNKRCIKSFYRGDNNGKYKITNFESFQRGENEFKDLLESQKLCIFESDLSNGESLDRISQLINFIDQAINNIKRGVSAVFIDYIQLIEPDTKTTNRAEELKAICSELKNLAVKTQLPITLAAQFSREGSKSPYELEPESLGEGGSIERYAALILGVWNTSKKPRQNSKYPETDKIWSDPNRNVKIEFNPNQPKIYIKLLKSRGEITQGEALLDCNLNVGVIYTNIGTKATNNKPQGEILPF